MPNKGRLKRTVEGVIKHVHSNAPTYITLVGTKAQKDYLAAITCLKVLILREVTGAIQRKIEKRKKDDEDKKIVTYSSSLFILEGNDARKK